MLSLVRLERASQEGDVWVDMSPEGHEINQVDILEHQLTSAWALVQEFSMSTEDASMCVHWMGGKGRKKTRDRSEESQEAECSEPCWLQERLGPCSEQERVLVWWSALG